LPDKKSIHLIAGNHVDVPKMEAYRLPETWKEDNLFPLIKDFLILIIFYSFFL